MDRNCIERCLDGHPEAYRELVGRYQAILLSFLAGQLNDGNLAEEAAQETFVRAYFALNKLKKPDSFVSWLLGIAGRVAKEQQRDRKRQRDLAGLWSERNQEPELSNDLALERAIGELPDIYREVVLLRYYGDQTCSQVAEQLDIPLGTVTKRLSRAYQMLRESIRRHENLPGQLEVRP
ncbi:MAG: RNA polymerase sigma factor [Planctomycetota bacterium]|nr:MAG: RNA polymerase sigma factor [Planctomycetota bacterium]